MGCGLAIWVLYDIHATRQELVRVALDEYTREFYEDEVAIPDPLDELSNCRFLGLLCLALAVISALLGFVWPLFYIIAVLALLGAATALNYWIRYRFFEAPAPSLSLASIAFRRDHLVLVDRATGDRRVVLLDELTQISVLYREVYFRFYFLKLGLQRVELAMLIKDVGPEVSIPLSFKGAGEFLAICRHAGAHVIITQDTPEQKEFAQWGGILSHRFDPPPVFVPRRPAPKIVDVVCNGCGAKSSLDRNATSRACEYCGSADLTSV